MKTLFVWLHFKQYCVSAFVFNECNLKTLFWLKKKITFFFCMVYILIKIYDYRYFALNLKITVCLKRIFSFSFLFLIFSDPRRGCYMVLHAFIFFSFFFPPRFCPGHISGNVTRRDSRLSVLLGPAV